jgi:hypothetical protein
LCNLSPRDYRARINECAARITLETAAATFVPQRAADAESMVYVDPQAGSGAPRCVL